MYNRKRPNKLSLYLDDVELKILDEKTTLSRSKNRNDFIRGMIVNGEIKYEDFSAIRDHNWKLSNIANNLNQIAHVANATGRLSDDNLLRAREYMEEVWLLQKSILSNPQFKNL